ncbi:hypothetical protein [Acinetobacter sp. MB5]|uniref:hypothetical protein n=1 Tax=Acinetobacter sp. MB5 TaxID=2069438 RepID=UPI000DCF881E|nr:hypothetical protein [Acinetobacter sp. MB5]
MIKEQNSIHIVISGIGLKVSNELKSILRDIIPESFQIKWTNLADPYINLLIVNSEFLDFDGIQKLLCRPDIAFLKVSKDNQFEGQFIENTIYTPCRMSDELKNWVQKYVLNTASTENEPNIPESILNTLLDTQKTIAETDKITSHAFNLAHLQHLHQHAVGKMFIYDNYGTLAVADIANKIAWLNPDREEQSTNKTFNYHSAKTDELTKVSRKKIHNLNDWLWNLFWCSSDETNLSPQTGCYKISFWPQPWNKTDRNDVLKLSACFIHGADFKVVQEQLHIPEETIRRFIFACMAANNGHFIPASECGYKKREPLTTTETIEDNGIKKIFGKLRKYFGL